VGQQSPGARSGAGDGWQWSGRRGAGETRRRGDLMHTTHVPMVAARTGRLPGPALPTWDGHNSVVSPCLACHRGGMQQTWGDASHPARATLRPDGRWLLRLPDDAATSASLLAERPPVVDRIQVLTQDERGHRALRDLGFRAMRTEQRWLLPLAALEREAVKASDHEIRPVLGCDLERVTDLDNAVR